jgi:hypothetical protein
LCKPGLIASSIPSFSFESSYSVEAGHDFGGIDVLVAGISTIWISAIRNGEAVRSYQDKIFFNSAKKLLDK